VLCVRVLLCIQGAPLILQTCVQQCMLVRCAMCTCAMCMCAAVNTGHTVDPASVCAAVHGGSPAQARTAKVCVCVCVYLGVRV